MTNTSSKIIYMLNRFGKKQKELIPILNMANKNTLSGKIRNDRWNVDDLLNVAEYLNCELCFILPDGEHVTLRHIKEAGE